ncbi:MAG: hypothetical protein AB1610_11445 [Nitrospirota bacterium]
MWRNKTISLMIIWIFIFTNFISPITASAQEPMAFGEIKSAGDVQIESSTGKWIKALDIYPLLKYTKLRTIDGVAFITTVDGSKIDLSEKTEVTIEAATGSYTINLEKGIISFNIKPSATVVFITRDATISVSPQVGGYYSLVAGPGAPILAQDLANIQGVISCDEKGTFIRSISGKLKVIPEGLEARILDSGGSIFASSAGVTGAPVAGGGILTTKTALIVGGVLVVGGAVVALGASRDEDEDKGVASPSGF